MTIEPLQSTPVLATRDPLRRRQACLHTPSNCSHAIEDLQACESQSLSSLKVAVSRPAPPRGWRDGSRDEARGMVRGRSTLIHCASGRASYMHILSCKIICEQDSTKYMLLDSHIRQLIQVQ